MELLNVSNLRFGAVLSSPGLKLANAVVKLFEASLESGLGGGRVVHAILRDAGPRFHVCEPIVGRQDSLHGLRQGALAGLGLACGHADGHSFFFFFRMVVFALWVSWAVVVALAKLASVLDAR